MPRSSGSICSVASCKSRSTTIKNITFHTFPKDVKLRKEWAKKCYRKDSFNTKNARICSLHFLASDFEDAFKARVMGILPKKLNKNAIPSLRLKPEEKRTIGDNDNTQQFQTKQTKQHAVFIKVENNEPSNDIENQHNIDISHYPGDKQKFELVILNEQLVKLENENENQHNIDISNYSTVTEKDELEILNKKLVKLEKENKSLHEKVQKLLLSKESVDQELFKVKRELELSKSNFVERVKEAFKHFLSPKQVELILKKKSKTRWTHEEISKADAIRKISKRCYVYLRETLKFPLPGISTLQQWAANNANINQKNEILDGGLNVKSVSEETTTPVSEIVLDFEEIKVEFDEKNDYDEAIGPVR